MNPDMSSSNIAVLLYTITPYRRRLSMTIIDRRRRRDRKKEKKRSVHLLHHIDLDDDDDDDDDDHHHHHFLICLQKTWRVYCHLVTPLAHIFKTSSGWIYMIKIEHISLCYLDLMRDLSDIFLLLLLLRLSSSCSYSHRTSYYVNE